MLPRGRCESANPERCPPVFQWLTALAPVRNPQKRRSFYASARKRAHIRSRGLLREVANTGWSIGFRPLLQAPIRKDARVSLLQSSHVLSPRIAFRNFGEDIARRYHDNSVEWSTVAVPSAGPEWRWIESSRCCRFAPFATKCKHVVSHVARCKQDSVTERSQALVLPARGQGRWLRPHSCRPDWSAQQQTPSRCIGRRGTLPRQLGRVVSGAATRASPHRRWSEPTGVDSNFAAECRVQDLWKASALYCKGGSAEQSEALTFGAS